jgi:glycosyltransferase 2 family protein
MSRRAKVLLGLALSILLLGWTLRDVSLAVVLRHMGEADPLLFVLAIAIATAGFAVRAARWHVLLIPISRATGFRNRFAATTIGFAANNLLPARVGEVVRAFALGRLERIALPAAIGSLAVERVLDGVVLVAFLFLAAASPGFPSVTVAGVDVRAAALPIAAVMMGGGLAFLLLALAPARARSVGRGIARRFLPGRFQGPVLRAAAGFVTGLAALRDIRLLFLSVVWAVGQWLFLALSFYLGFRAFGIDEVGYVGALFLQSLVSLAVAIPSSPGFFGPFEAAARIGLELWGVDPGRAVSFAVGFHLGGFVPVTLIGLWYLWRTPITWGDLKRADRGEEVPVHG